MVKRIVSLAMVLAVSMSLLAGCAAKAPADSNTPAPVAKAKEVTLTLWQQASRVETAMIEIQNEFLKENPDIKFNIVEQADMGTSAVLSAIAAGNAPSVFGGGYPTMTSYIFQNAAMPIDDYIAKTPDFANFDKTQVDTFLVNGKHYAVPGDKYVMGFLYNKKLFKEAGITNTPTTWDEFYDAAKKLTIPSKQQYGFGLDGTQWASWHFEQWVWGAGGDLSKKNADGTATLTFDDPAVKTASDFYRKLKSEKLIQTDANMQLEAIAKDFAMGKSGMIVGGLQSQQVGELVGKGMKIEDLGFFVNPKGPSGKAYAQIGGDVWFIPVTKDKDLADAAWKWIMYVNSKSSLDKIMKERSSKGAIGAGILPRTDLKASDYGTPIPELQSAMDASNAIGRDEYYAKGAVGAVADDAIAKWFANPTMDVEKSMKAAQEAANDKELKDFNNAVTSAK